MKNLSYVVAHFSILNILRPLDVHFIVVIVPVATITSGLPMSALLKVCFYSIVFNPALVWIPFPRIT